MGTAEFNQDYTGDSESKAFTFFLKSVQKRTRVLIWQNWGRLFIFHGLVRSISQWSAIGFWVWTIVIEIRLV